MDASPCPARLRTRLIIAVLGRALADSSDTGLRAASDGDGVPPVVRAPAANTSELVQLRPDDGRTQSAPRSPDIDRGMSRREIERKTSV
jgi:hypothetical protein